MKNFIKKINWHYVLLVIFLIATMIIGALLAEEEWIETTTTVIWVTGMILITIASVCYETVRFFKKALDDN